MPDLAALGYISIDDRRDAELLGGDPDIWEPITDDWCDHGVSICLGEALFGRDSHE